LEEIYDSLSGILVSTRSWKKFGNVFTAPSANRMSSIGAKLVKFELYKRIKSIGKRKIFP